MIAASASTADPTLNLKLNKEILQIYATKVALQGQKNLDLVQSILISSLWYYPPERYEAMLLFLTCRTYHNGMNAGKHSLFD